MAEYRKANEDVIKQMLKYEISSDKIPSNATDWIHAILKKKDGPMNEFHLSNASLSRVVQVDYNFSGTTASGKKWNVQYSVNADLPNDKHGHPHHYGGEIEGKDVNGSNIKAPAIHVDLSKVTAGRPNDKGYQMEEYRVTRETKRFDDGGTAEWECTSKKTGY
ncbi:unnamed protein product [Didymodactylos carnosus]|uniref:Uncharacterized protein n=1 Tax=Didymodactylos carnosus TaxID=1234261 RepID=A0A8S2JWF6_9BILA|nr:unnamed protein product [Didymodactylos carnosus]CAF3828505.1 unnamed protein product [Didymodactylos carnosus]